MWNEKIISYAKKTKNFARANRQSGNLSEVLLWKLLKDRKLNGLKFSRQIRIGDYIVDLYCKERKVALEIDGWTHDNKQDYDHRHDKFLADNGVTVIHIDDIDVKKQMDKVIYILENHTALQPTPSPHETVPAPPRPSGESDRPEFKQNQK